MDLTGIIRSSEAALCAYTTPLPVSATVAWTRQSCILPLFPMPMREVEIASIIMTHTLRVTRVLCLQAPYPICSWQDSQSLQQHTSRLKAWRIQWIYSSHLMWSITSVTGLGSPDPTSSGNPSNATSAPFQFPLFDGISYVTLLLIILCRTTFFRLCVVFHYHEAVGAGRRRRLHRGEVIRAKSQEEVTK